MWNKTEPRPAGSATTDAQLSGTPAVNPSSRGLGTVSKGPQILVAQPKQLRCFGGCLCYIAEGYPGLYQFLADLLSFWFWLPQFFRLSTKCASRTALIQASAQYGVSGKGVIYALIDCGFDWQNNEWYHPH